MLRRLLERSTAVVTGRSRVTLLAMVLLSAVVLAGIPQVDTSSEASASPDAFDDVDRVQTFQYVQEHYLNETRDERNRTIAIVYVRTEGSNVLSKASLLAELRFQRAVRGDEALRAALHETGIQGIATLVALRAAGDRDADLDEQIDALEGLSASEVEGVVGRTLAEDPRSRRFLPADHEVGSTSATDKRLLVALRTDASDATRSDATAVLHRAAERRSASGYFTLGEHELAQFQSHSITNLIELVVPLALALILFVLAFSYRDLVDIVVGMAGVVLSILWMVGLLGWLGVAAGTIIIVPIVLITGLSIDFGFHVFNRYREQRQGDRPLRESMAAGVRLVATALLLVTATAAIGFLSNLTNPLPLIRNLGITITLGVVAALVIFTTAVPALKVEIDAVLERLGRDRRKAPLGHGRYLRPMLAGSVTLARRAAPVVIVLSIAVGAAGGAAWTALDQESFQTGDADVAQWKQDLPQPLGWDVHEYRRNRAHVDAVYRPASQEAAFQSRILIEGDTTGDRTLELIHAGTEQLRTTGILLDQPGTRAVRSPVTAMAALAARNESFAAAFAAADTDGNGVPDSDLHALYEQFYATDPDAARGVIERSGGSYPSLLVTLTLDVDPAQVDAHVGTLEDGAATMRGDGDAREVTVAGVLAMNQAVLASLTAEILVTMVVALVAILVALTGVFRLTHGSATLGAVVAVPIALVIGLVIGGMYLLDVPLTLLTALLMSLVIGLGVDYNIHVGDRFADELRAGVPRLEALRAAVTGTGGALLGSSLTSAGAFATFVLVPAPQLQSFGVIVVLALVTSFLTSVLVLPSILWVWSARFGVAGSPGS